MRLGEAPLPVGVQGDQPRPASPTRPATIMTHAAALAEIATLLPNDADRTQLEELVLGLAVLPQRLGRQDEATGVGGGSA